MSLNHTEQIKCPNCGEAANFEIWESINVDLNPEMREMVLSGNLFNFKCPHCDKEAKLGYPFLYHDMKHKFLIYFCDENDIDKCKKALDDLTKNEETKEIAKSEKYRIVTSYLQLVEKIKIFESGLDDRMIELLKLQQIVDCRKNRPENHFAFALFDLIVNPHAKKKGAVPTITFINENGDKVFDCDISYIPGAISRIGDDYDYSDDNSYQIDMSWANKYINGEKLDFEFLSVKYDETVIDNTGSKLAYGLINLPDNETSSHYFLALSNKEQDATVVQSGVELEELRDVLMAFYRYTNFQTILRYMEKPKYHSNSNDEFRRDSGEELEFLKNYFIESMKGFEPLCMYYIKLLIHGKTLDKNHPLKYGVDNREEGPFGMYRALKNRVSQNKEETVANLLDLYERNRNEEFSKALKNAIIFEMFKFALPEEEVYVVEPSLAENLLNELKKLKDNFYFAKRNGLSEEKIAETKEIIKDQAVEIWKIAFQKRDVAACFEELAGYFYDKQMFREAYFNQVFSCAYVPNARLQNFMYIKKQYKSEITAEELKEYEEKYELPVIANPELEKEIVSRYKMCLEEQQYMGAIYYLNLCYNFYGEKDNTAKQIDDLIDSILDKIDF